MTQAGARSGAVVVRRKSGHELTSIFELLVPAWDRLVVGLGMNASLGLRRKLSGLDYDAFFRAA